ncbi:NAD(P)/FAD-dependent oxidoreductase [Candidatus Uabimicrobium sp. HlEnr_7]|uniref:NAD(P)/FAD-dependent oxidoreductase n=1 Tax=Candidatus Uabimicrobium helgolandensis TaxID=3095367 RepID=UPI0035572904
MTKIYDTIIIGAGISGLIAATQLQKAGKNTIVVDKARGVGGRMATRRFAEATFDHGAQFFTVRSSEFANFIREAEKQNVVRKWCSGFLYGEKNNEVVLRDDGYPRYCGTKGMTSLAKMLSTDLEIKLQEKIESANYNGNWHVHGTQEYVGKSVIMTAPIPQSLAILKDVDFDGREALTNIEYTPCFAIMVKMSAPSNIPQPGGIKNMSADIEWIGDNTQKGISSKPSITIHATADFTQKNWDSDFDEVANILLQQAQKWLNGDMDSYQVHRWRYCGPKNVYPHKCFTAKNLSLVMCGDAFAGPKVEGAFLSGIAAAQATLY